MELTEQQKKAKETEANVFACALLMPPELLAKDVVKQFGGHDCIDIIDDYGWAALAKLYNVSQSLMVWWFSFLTEHRSMKKEFWGLLELESKRAKDDKQNISSKARNGSRKTKQKAKSKKNA